MRIPVAGRVLKLPRPVVTLALVGLLGGAGFFAFRLFQPQPSQKTAETMTVSAKTQDLDVRIRATGTVVPIQGVNVSPKSAGRLVELYVDQGDRVRQGQVVARMEDESIQAQLAQAEAALAQAEARYLEARNGSRREEIEQAAARAASAQAQAKLAQDRRTRNSDLLREGAISRDQFESFLTDERRAQADLQAEQKNLERLRNGSRPETIAEAKAAVAQAQAQVLASQVQLRDTVIRAPFSGIITQKFANVGAFVTPTTSASTTSSATSTSIVAIASTLEILAKVPETSISQIRIGQPIEIRADAYPGKKFKGQVRLIAPEAIIDQGVTSFQVRISLTSGQSELKSGMNADLTFLGGEIKQAVVVPTVAIVTQQGRNGVLVPDSQKQPEFRPVEIGISSGDQVQVVDGLKPGEQVFVYLPRSMRSGSGEQGGQRSGRAAGGSPAR